MYTTIRLKTKTKDRLDSIGIKASYDKIINIILNENYRNNKK